MVEMIAELRSHGASLYSPDHPTALLLWKAAAALEALGQHSEGDVKPDDADDCPSCGGLGYTL
jgi:hypothetical protein